MVNMLKEYMASDPKKGIPFYVFCDVHCNIITQYKPTKYSFPKLIF